MPAVGPVNEPNPSAQFRRYYGTLGDKRGQESADFVTGEAAFGELRLHLSVERRTIHDRHPQVTQDQIVAISGEIRGKTGCRGAMRARAASEWATESVTKLHQQLGDVGVEHTTMIEGPGNHQHASLPGPPRQHWKCIHQ
jgi:hypothetical protein